MRKFLRDYLDDLLLMVGCICILYGLSVLESCDHLGRGWWNADWLWCDGRKGECLK